MNTFQLSSFLIMLTSPFLKHCLLASLPPLYPTSVTLPSHSPYLKFFTCLWGSILDHSVVFLHITCTLSLSGPTYSHGLTYHRLPTALPRHVRSHPSLLHLPCASPLCQHSHQKLPAGNPQGLVTDTILEHHHLRRQTQDIRSDLLEQCQKWNS